jgi:hypothetical protein
MQLLTSFMDDSLLININYKRVTSYCESTSTFLIKKLIENACLISFSLNHIIHFKFLPKKKNNENFQMQLHLI